MAFVLQQGGVGSLAHPFYVGESNNVRPRPDEATATLYETDTGTYWTWRDRQWIPLRSEAATVAVLRDVLCELRGLRLDLTKQPAAASRCGN